MKFRAPPKWPGKAKLRDYYTAAILAGGPSASMKWLENYMAIPVEAQKIYYDKFRNRVNALLLAPGEVE